jgi:hypothetical protein
MCGELNVIFVGSYFTVRPVYVNVCVPPRVYYASQIICPLFCFVEFDCCT